VARARARLGALLLGLDPAHLAGAHLLGGGGD
jgi:hypothetical protein